MHCKIQFLNLFLRKTYIKYQRYNYLKKVIKRTLKLEQALNSTLSIIFVDEKEIKRINKEYRGNFLIALKATYNKNPIKAPTAFSKISSISKLLD